MKRGTATEALNYLNKIKARHSKVLHIVHRKIEIERYLTGNDLSVEECKFLFAIRTRMVEIRGNYKEKYLDTNCPLCTDFEDTQEHMLHCSYLVTEGEIVKYLPEYKNIFGRNLIKQNEVLRLLMNRYKMRKLKTTTMQSGPSDPNLLWSAVLMYY